MSIHTYLAMLERASLPVEEPEMLSVAKLIIQKLKVDEEQFAALMNSVGISVNAATQVGA